VSTSTAELTLVLRARNLADAELSKVRGSLDKVKTKAGEVAAKFKGAFAGVGSILSNIAGDVIAGKTSIAEAFGQVGVFAAASMIAYFAETILAKIASSGLIAAIGPAATALGTAIGGFIDAGIALATAGWPVLLLAAIVAAVVFLINNPELVNTIIRVAGQFIDTLLGALDKLPELLAAAIVATPGILAKYLPPMIVSIVNFLMQLPGKMIAIGVQMVVGIIKGMFRLHAEIARLVREAFQKLKIDVGPFHITAKGITIDLPTFSSGTGTSQYPHMNPPGSAMGGWVGRNGPEVIRVGERGPEYVTKHSDTFKSASPDYVAVGISARDIARMVDEQLYFTLQNASPTRGR
jgi:hypothetical protein